MQHHLVDRVCAKRFMAHYLEYCTQILNPHYIKDIKLIEGIQRCHGDTCGPIDLPAVPRYRPPIQCRCETPRSTELLTTSFIDPAWASCFRRLEFISASTVA